MDTITFPKPANETERLQTLHAYGLMETPPETVFDEVVSLATYVFQAPIATISLLDESRQWFKARVGFEMPETPREYAFCTYTVLQSEVMVVHDALADPRFASNPLVLGAPGIRFYAGAPLITREGHALGSLCVIDTKPRHHFDAREREALQTLGRHLMAQIEIRYSSAFLAKAFLERRQAEVEQQNRILEHGRELSRLHKMKDSFMTMLAHELRNPLASILNAVELLRSPDPDDAVDIIEAQVRHLSRLIEDLLDLSRVTRGKIALKMQTLDLGESLCAAVRAAQPMFAKNGQHFTVELPQETLWAYADPVRLEQIVSNLLVNAAKFTEPGKEICLRLQRKDGSAELRVKDEGMGIPQEMQAHIFEPFVQGKEARVREGSGLGLGLPLVKELVRLHNGSVEVQSAGQGHGSEFIVHLPLTEAPVAGASQEAGTTIAGIEAATAPVRHRVLLVEDDAALGATLKRLVSRWGHDVKLVTSGALALEAALQFHPDLAIVDLSLPQMNGCEVARRLCAAPELAGMRLIAISGYGEETDREEAMRAGFHAFFPKPVDLAALRNALER